MGASKVSRLSGIAPDTLGGFLVYGIFWIPHQVFVFFKISKGSFNIFLEVVLPNLCLTMAVPGYLVQLASGYLV